MEKECTPYEYMHSIRTNYLEFDQKIMYYHTYVFMVIGQLLLRCEV